MIRYRSIRTVCALTMLAVVCLGSSQASAYLKFGYEVNGKDYTLRWTTTPVRYFVTDAGVPGVTSSQFQSAVASAFQTWESVPTASITYQFAGFTDNDNARSRMNGVQDGVGKDYEELGRKPDKSTFIETWAFVSPVVFAYYRA